MTPDTAIQRLIAAPVQHNGERVITLPMMDETHGRPDGTARRNFNEHRARMAEGRHFFVLPADEFRTPDGRLNGASEVVYLTERGYLLLVKSFRDDLAWEVQERLVEGYFRARTDGGLSVAVQALTAALAPLIERVSRVEQLVVQGHSLPAQAFIPAHMVARTTRAVTALARARSAGRADVYKRERGVVDTELRARFNFAASYGCRWRNFPLSRFSELLAAVESLERQAERLTPPPQQALPFPRPA